MNKLDIGTVKNHIAQISLVKINIYSRNLITALWKITK